MSNEPQLAPEPTRVYVVYKDTRKDMSAAERFGQLTDMFSGRVNYARAVEQARKMLHAYKDGDYIVMVGDPTLCLIVGAVALEFSENQALNILRWDRDEIGYSPLALEFGEQEEPALTFGEATVSPKGRFG